jgi:hypothetical protein
MSTRTPRPAVLGIAPRTAPARSAAPPRVLRGPLRTLLSLLGPALALLGPALGLSAPAFAGENTVMVGLERAGALGGLPAAVAASGGQLGACYQRARFCLVELPSPASPALLSRWAALPGLRYAEADRRMALLPQQSVPADAAGTADCADLWELAALSADAGWAHAAGAPVLAVADGGFLQSHHEISGQISGQFDYGDLDPVANLELDVGVPGHGTFIAALLAGKGDNAEGRVGLVPGGALNLLKIADSSGAFYFSYAAAALADVADGDLGIGVVNYSLASTSSTSAFNDAVASLADVGVMLVAAAGNCGSADCFDADNDDYPVYPASLGYPHILTVAGSTRDNGYNNYSHYGALSVDLAAPGVDLCSAEVGADTAYATAAGTSYAAPLVAAAAGLLQSAHPSLSVVERARILRASAVDHPDWAGRSRSGGVLNVEAALSTALPRLSLPLPPDPIDETGVLELVIESPAAAGEAIALLRHGALVSVSGLSEPAWTVEPFAAGDTIDLPDAGPTPMTAAGALLRGPLDAHRTLVLRVALEGEAVGTGEASLRVVATSAGADYLNAPYDSGEEDETGFLALSVPLTVVATAAPDDSGAPGDGDGAADGDPDGGDGTDGTDGTADGADGADGAVVDEDGGAGSAEGAPAKDSGGCATGGRPSGAWALGAALLVAGGRRRLSAGSGAPRRGSR